MGEPAASGPAPSDTQTAADRAGARNVRRGAVVLLWLHATMLVLTLPVIALILLSSMWEGGDVAMKHRLWAWAPMAAIGNVVAAVLLGVAAGSVSGTRADRRWLLMTSSGVLLALAAGWAWVSGQNLLTDPSTLVAWVVLTAPGLLAAALVLAAPSGRRRRAGPPSL